ncbi:hypothetical protein GYA13_04740 [Candidatus Kuenenbacteria bacterium]|nr:hypothetical protein [Candidatus Kuenenbacteria bacterium]
MSELIFATTNQAKLAQIAGALKSLDIAVVGLDKNIPLPEVNEDGETAEVNARQKATAYARAINQPVLSMDNALYFDGLPPDKQPGVHVRRCDSDSVRCDDQGMLQYYSELIDNLGERINGHWIFALCFATPDGKILETSIISPRIFVSQPCARIDPGYPLESLQVDPNTGQYISEMTPKERDIFWQKAIGAPLSAFVKTLPLE